MLIVSQPFSLLLAVLLFYASSSASGATTTIWSKPAVVYMSSYAESPRARTVAILTPQLVGSITWTVQQALGEGCPAYPMDILISTQHGAVPWLNESAWSPELLVLRRQRFAIRLDNSVGVARVAFDTMGARLFYFTVISLAPEPSKVQKLGLSQEPCSIAVHFNPIGSVPIRVPLLQLDTNVTVHLQDKRVSFFRLALPQSAYSIRLDVADCGRVHDGDSVGACQFLARVSVGTPEHPRPGQASLVFADNLSPLSDASFLSLVAIGNPLKLTFSVSVHQHCRLPSSSASAATSGSNPACELFPLSLQNYGLYGEMFVHPSSPDTAGSLRISPATPVVIPFTVRGLVDSRRYLLIDIRSYSGPVMLQFCLGRRLSLGLGDSAECELRFGLREQGSLRRVMPHPPAGVWYLAIVNRLTASAKIQLQISTTGCPSLCSKGGRCDIEKLEAFPVHVCRCYDGFAGDMCEARVPVSPDPLAALLLLCLSNAAFLPTVALACRRGLLVEALIYCMAMLASALYHACDNNYARQLCVLPFDTLGKLDFLGAFLSLWVTLLLLVELTQPLKQLVQTAGSLFLMIGVLVNRTSFVIIAVPLGVGFLALVVSWSCRCFANRRCYPPLRLLVTSLLPGGALALAGFAMFALLDTRATYFLVHSGWHCCVAFAILLLLLPRDQLRFLPRGGDRSCGADRCFVLVSHDSVGNGSGSDVAGGGIKGDVEYSALPMVPATASSGRDGILGNGSLRRPTSATSVSSSSEEDETEAMVNSHERTTMEQVLIETDGAQHWRRRGHGSSGLRAMGDNAADET